MCNSKASLVKIIVEFRELSKIFSVAEELEESKFRKKNHGGGRACSAPKVNNNNKKNVRMSGAE